MTDTIITQVSSVPAYAPAAHKVYYLVKLTKLNKTTKQNKLFIATDRELHGFLLKAKGLWFEGTEEYARVNYKDIVANAPKDNFVEIEFGSSIIDSVQNLVFKAK
jgi:hypothetical protein